jgi:hypothetical protein
MDGNVDRKCAAAHTQTSQLPSRIELMTPEAVIRAVARSGLGLEPADRLRETLEEQLFSVVLPGVDDGDVPRIVAEVLLRLHSDLQEGKNARVASRLAFDQIRGDPEARVLSPVEVMIAGLEDAAKLPGPAYSEAKRLASLPWSTLGTLLPCDLAGLVDSLHLEIEAVLHEVEEGFVDPKTCYPDVARSAAALAPELRKYGSAPTTTSSDSGGSEGAAKGGRSEAERLQ